MEEEYFNEIRDRFCTKSTKIKAGKMMSSAAITYNDKVFAFFSRKKKMVFKLGKSFEPELHDFDIQVFNPFKKRGPLNGWFEVPYSESEYWEKLSQQALELIQQKIK